MNKSWRCRIGWHDWWWMGDTRVCLRGCTGPPWELAEVAIYPTALSATVSSVTTKRSATFSVADLCAMAGLDPSKVYATGHYFNDCDNGRTRISEVTLVETIESKQ